MKFQALFAQTENGCLNEPYKNYFKEHSSEELMVVRNKIRQESDAIIIGANTLINDDPKFSSYFGFKIIFGVRGFIGHNFKIFQDPSKVLIVFENNDREKDVDSYRAVGIEHFLSVDSFMSKEKSCMLAKVLGIKNIVVEGGIKTLNHFMTVVETVHTCTFPCIGNCIENSARLLENRTLLYEKMFSSVKWKTFK